MSLAILFLSIEQSAWRLLPNYTELPSEKWRDYLRGKNGLKMLWPAQQLIGNSNILRGVNGIVQLPTGVGKTKSIELIIRSAFVEQRVSIVVIVAPLRALCNEITTDMIKTFGGEVKINQFSDVLQEDIAFFDDYLDILQKRVKYGVATKTAVSICETIFNDRVLATKLTNIIGDDNISSEKLLENIKHNKRKYFRN